MKKNIIKRMYQKADADLTRAQDELYRPERDVVFYSSCVSARSALYHYLGCLSVLSEKKVDIYSIENGTKSMDQLILETGKKYPEITKLDFSVVKCKSEDISKIVKDDETHFCNNTDMVNSCTNLAFELKKIVDKRASKFIQP